MPWQPFRRKNKYRHVEEHEEETSFDELLPRSASDGNLVRAPSERFLLQNIDHRKSYGTCSSGTSCWTSFIDHTVLEGETLAGLSIRYNITIQDIKLANKIWTNEGLWPGRTLRIPIVEAGVPGLDLSGSETMSTDSQVSACVTGCSQSSSSAGSSRRLSNNDSGLFPDSPISLPLTSRSPRNSAQIKSRSASITSSTNNVESNSNSDNRASIENLSDFLSKMDSSIAVNKKATISMIKSSNIECEPENSKSNGCDSSLNNTHTRLSDSSADEEVSVAVSNNNTRSRDDGRGDRGARQASVTSLTQSVRGYQGYQNIC